MFEKSYLFKGKHAEIVKRLTSPLEPGKDQKFQIFERYVDVLECGAIVGFNYGLMADEDTKGEISPAEIPVNTMCNEQQRILFIYKVIMLNETQRGLSDEERIDNAFRFIDENNETVQDNLKLFYQYVRGGIEKLDDLFGAATTRDDVIEVMKTLLDDAFHAGEEIIDIVN